MNEIKRNSSFVTILLGEPGKGPQRRWTFSKFQFEVILFLLPALFVWSVIATTYVCYLMASDSNMRRVKSDVEQFLTARGKTPIVETVALNERVHTESPVSSVNKNSLGPKLAAHVEQKIESVEEDVAIQPNSDKTSANGDHRILGRRHGNIDRQVLSDFRNDEWTQGITLLTKTFYIAGVRIRTRLFIDGDDVNVVMKASQDSTKKTNGSIWVRLSGRSDNGNDFELSSATSINESGELSDQSEGVGFNLKNSVQKSFSLKGQPLNQTDVVTSILIGIRVDDYEPEINRYDL